MSEQDSLTPEHASPAGDSLPLPPFLPGTETPPSAGNPDTPPLSGSPEGTPPAGTEQTQTGQDLLRQQWQEQVARWRQEVADDPELGGDHLPGVVARAQLALDRFDTDRTIGRLLEESGYGNHPAVIRFFTRVADALAEDSLPASRPDAALPPLEERMYAGWSSRA